MGLNSIKGQKIDLTTDIHRKKISSFHVIGSL